MNKKKILYIMHVDWRWIKQRPHFIAEGLSEFYDVTVVHFVSKNFLFEEYDLSINNKTNFNVLPALRLPFYQKKFFYGLNKFYLRLYFKLLITFYNPDFIWITFPLIYDYIPYNRRYKIIYDCMDEATGFDFNENLKFKILDLEKKISNDASIIFTSSNNLFNNLDKKYHCKDKLILVRNAFDGKIINHTVNNIKNRKKFKIGYIGTISKWIDFEKIKITLEEFKNIEYHFIGPSESKINEMAKHKRINFYGTIHHNKLYDYVKEFDCLIMPFKLNKLTKSVDPVKLYEYINYNKPIISIYYEELNYFAKFVSFYSNTNELITLLKQMIDNPVIKYSKSERVKFLESNSWKDRISEIIKNLD